MLCPMGIDICLPITKELWSEQTNLPYWRKERGSRLTASSEETLGPKPITCPQYIEVEIERLSSKGGRIPRVRTRDKAVATTLNWMKETRVQLQQEQRFSIEGILLQIANKEREKPRSVLKLSQILEAPSTIQLSAAENPRPSRTLSKSENVKSGRHYRKWWNRHYCKCKIHTLRYAGVNLETCINNKTELPINR